MKVSLNGLLERVAHSVGGGNGYSYMLRELLKNLRELHERKAEGEKVIDEFFALYVLEPKSQATEEGGG